MQAANEGLMIEVELVDPAQSMDQLINLRDSAETMDQLINLGDINNLVTAVNNTHLGMLLINLTTSTMLQYLF